jgi:hypothetical protein
LVPVTSLPQAAMGSSFRSNRYHGTVRTHVCAVACLRGHHRPLRSLTLEVEALLLFRWGIPEVGGLVRGARVLTGLTGQDDLLLICHLRAVGVNKGGIFYQSYCELVTYYQILLMFALVVKLLSLTLNLPFFGYQYNRGSIDLQWVPTGYRRVVFLV